MQVPTKLDQQNTAAWLSRIEFRRGNPHKEPRGIRLRREAIATNTREQTTPKNCSQFGGRETGFPQFAGAHRNHFVSL